MRIKRKKEKAAAGKRTKADLRHNGPTGYLSDHRLANVEGVDVILMNWCRYVLSLLFSGTTIARLEEFGSITRSARVYFSLVAGANMGLDTKCLFHHDVDANLNI